MRACHLIGGLMQKQSLLSTGWMLQLLLPSDLTLPLLMSRADLAVVARKSVANCSALLLTLTAGSPVPAGICIPAFVACFSAACRSFTVRPSAVGVAVGVSGSLSLSAILERLHRKGQISSRPGCWSVTGEDNPVRKAHMWSRQQVHVRQAAVHVAWRGLTLLRQQGQNARTLCQQRLFTASVAA